MEKIETRFIEASDNRQLAGIIRDGLTEFKANNPGTVYYDDSTDHLFELFQADRCIYKVGLINNEIVGGCGIYPNTGLDEDTCELVKLYLSPIARGKGLAKRLVNECMKLAKANGFTKIYLETMPELVVAVPLYEKLGFTYLTGPLGNSGHNGCNIWMIKTLSEV